MKKLKSRGGFTYVELLSVAVIVAILFIIAVPNFMEAHVRAGVARSRADLASLTMALEDYRADHRMYPPNREPGKPNGWDLFALTTPVAYISSLPMDVFSFAGEKERARARRDGKAPPQPAPYVYLNAMQTNESGFKDLSREVMDGFVGALLWGRGPDLALGTTVEANQSRLIAYDPTNGSATPGDIYARAP